MIGNIAKLAKTWTAQKEDESEKNFVAATIVIPKPARNGMLTF
jgi:hypothetical protein